MRFLLLSVASIFFLNSFTMASSLYVIGACDSKPVYQSAAIAHLPTVSLGDFTVKVLSDAQIPFKGTREGITSILNSRTGDDALEVLSDAEMRAYGWCVSIDGKQPSQMPDKVMLTNVNSRVVWFYAYARYAYGEWKEFCVPSYQLKSPFVCAAKKAQLIQ